MKKHFYFKRHQIGAVFTGLTPGLERFGANSNELHRPSDFSFEKQVRAKMFEYLLCSLKPEFLILISFFLFLYFTLHHWFLSLRYYSGRGGEREAGAERAGRGEKRFIGFLSKDSDSVGLNWTVLKSCIFKHFLNWWSCAARFENYGLIMS